MKQITQLSLLLTLIITLVACAPAASSRPAPTPTPSPSQTTPLSNHPTPRERIKTIQNYVVYYSAGRVDDLARYDLAIIQPDTLTAEELAGLKSRGSLVVAYLSVGEAEPGRPWFEAGRVKPEWILGRDENWGAYYVDARQPGWQQLMIELTGEFIAKGFDGVFLDTVDTVDIFPDTTAGMLELIHRLRAAYPQALLVQNRGFSVAQDVAADIDAVMFEDLSTTYNFDSRTYARADNAGEAQEMLELHAQTGLPILALDYAPPDNPAMAYLAIETAKQYGFIPSVSVINLDDIPDYGLSGDKKPDTRVSAITAESDDGQHVTLVAIIENVGLAEAKNIPLSMTINDTEVATSTCNLLPGDQFEWRYAWPQPKGRTPIVVTASSTDPNPRNNTRRWVYSPGVLALEPLLSPDRQKRRPATNGPDLTLTALTGPITLDGDLSDWSGYPCTEVNQKEQVSYGDVSQWSGPADLSGRVCYGWDAANLYIGLSMQDDTIVQKFTGSSLWKGDHVELWFDAQLQLDFDNSQPGDDDFQLGLSPGDFDKVKPDFVIFTPAVPREKYAEMVEYAVTRTAAGYDAEIVIPARLLKGLRLSPEHTIGAAFEPSDTDTPGGTDQELMMSSAPQSSQNWGNPTLWNNLIIKGEPAVPSREVKLPVAAAPVKRDLSSLAALPAANVPSDVTAIIGYSFDPGDVSQPITAEALAQARATVQKAAAEGALWLDADTGITNFADAFINDPAISYYPLAQAIIEEAHQAGVKVFFYFSATEIETPNFAQRAGPAIHEAYPDWPQIDQFGRPLVFEPGKLNFFWLDEDEADARMNPLSPGFREAIFSRSEKLAQLGADGLFYDVGYFFTIDNRWGDFSDFSAQAFKADTGLALPKNLAADGRTYAIWLDWRHKVWADFYADLRARVRQVNPHTQIIVEEYPGATLAGVIETGLDPAIVDASLDVAAHEYDHRQDEGGAIVYQRDDWQHTRDVYKWYQGMNRVNWSLCYATGPADSRALAAISYAHQQSFWETKAPTMLDESAGPGWRKQLLAWLAQNGAAFNQAQPAAEVAVLLSGRTRNLTYAANMDELVSAQHALDQAGVPYVIITEPNIGRIHDFPYLILPGVTYATDAVLAEVNAYKGTLLLTGNSFSRDGWDENNLEPPAELLSVNEALARIVTTPVQIDGGEGLFIELFRQGDTIQVRLFNPDLNAQFQATPRPVTLRFKWLDRTLAVSQLDFMADVPITLTPTAVDEAVEVKTEVGLMSLITISVR